MLEYFNLRSFQHRKKATRISRFGMTAEDQPVVVGFDVHKKRHSIELDVFDRHRELRWGPFAMSPMRTLLPFISLLRPFVRCCCNSHSDQCAAPEP